MNFHKSLAFCSSALVYLKVISLTYFRNKIKSNCSFKLFLYQHWNLRDTQRARELNYSCSLSLLLL